MTAGDLVSLNTIPSWLMKQIWEYQK